MSSPLQQSPCLINEAVYEVKPFIPTYPDGLSFPLTDISKCHLLGKGDFEDAYLSTVMWVFNLAGLVLSQLPSCLLSGGFLVWTTSSLWKTVVLSFKDLRLLIVLLLLGITGVWCCCRELVSKSVRI